MVLTYRGNIVIDGPIFSFHQTQYSNEIIVHCSNGYYINLISKEVQWISGNIINNELNAEINMNEKISIFRTYFKDIYYIIIGDYEIDDAYELSHCSGRDLGVWWCIGNTFVRKLKDLIKLTNEYKQQGL